MRRVWPIQFPLSLSDLYIHGTLVCSFPQVYIADFISPRHVQHSLEGRWQRKCAVYLLLYVLVFSMYLIGALGGVRGCISDSRITHLPVYTYSEQVV